MPKKSGLAQSFYWNGLDISGDVGALDSVGSPRQVLEVPGIDKSAMERLLGHGDGSISFNSWFNDAAGQAHGGLSALPTTDVILLWALGGAIDDVAAGLVAKQLSYDPNRGQDGSLAFSVQGLANGTPLEWLVMLTSGLDTHASAVSAGTSFDGGASSANGLVAYLSIDDIDSGTPTVVLEDSPDNSVWSTLISFTAVADGGEPTAERKTVTGTVNRYLRINSTGTFTNLDFALAYRRGTAQDDVAL